MQLIVAADPTGGIGYKNKLPWTNIQGDLPRFKNLTTGKTIVMGRNTWESLPKKPLPNRLNLVVTKSNLDSFDNTIQIRDIEELNKYDDLYLIGGASLIQSLFDRVNKVYLTVTFAKYLCDTHIDLVKLNKEFSLDYQEVNSDHTFEIWIRK
jgi:dihydrofolate reductase